MSKYLIKGKYLSEGIGCLLKEGASSRVNSIEKLVSSLGGSTENIYYSFGEWDIYGIVDMPDQASMAALSLKVSSSGFASVTSTTLIEPMKLIKLQSYLLYTGRLVNHRLTIFFKKSIALFKAQETGL